MPAITTDSLLITGIGVVATVVGILWKIVIARNKRCEEENVRMAMQIKELDHKFGMMNGKLLAISSMVRSCASQGCGLNKLKFMEDAI